MMYGRPSEQDVLDTIRNDLVALGLDPDDIDTIADIRAACARRNLHELIRECFEENVMENIGVSGPERRATLSAILFAGNCTHLAVETENRLRRHFLRDLATCNQRLRRILLELLR